MQKKVSLVSALILSIVIMVTIVGCATSVAASSNSHNSSLVTVTSNSLGRATAVPVISDAGLSVGDIAFVISPPDNVVRKAPGRNGRYHGSFPAGTVLEIRGGPTYANGMTWWWAYAHAQNLTGWTSEGDPPGPSAEQFLAPINGRIVCADTYRTRLDIGSTAYVLTNSGGANRLRHGAGTNHRVLGRIQPGQNMQIIDGPVCAQNMIWWKVVVDNNRRQRGWTSEGEWKNYYLAPESLLAQK